MSRLVALIDDYRDRHGQPSNASIARAIGVAPQTISAWRNRGVRELPKVATLRKLAAYLGLDYKVVFDAAGMDTGYITADPETGEQVDLAAGLESGQIAARRSDPPPAV